MRQLALFPLLVFAVITSVAQQAEKHTLYFNYGKDQLTSVSAGKLDNLLSGLETDDVLQVHLEGHTDSDGSESYNLKLSSKRVAFVLRYLIEKGISEGTIRTAYYGKSRPIATNTTPDGRRKNRRVEITVLHSGDINVQSVHNNKELPCASPIQVTEKEVLYFIYGKHELTEASKIKVDQILEKLSNQNIIQIELAGHTDSDGSIIFNMNLSERRVGIVRNYLSSIGIEGELVDGRSHGESKPVAPNITEAGKQKNRRVEMVISFNDCAEEQDRLADGTSPADNDSNQVPADVPVAEKQINDERPASHTVLIVAEEQGDVQRTTEYVPTTSSTAITEQTIQISATPETAKVIPATDPEIVTENNDIETARKNTPATDVLSQDGIMSAQAEEYDENEPVTVSENQIVNQRFQNQSLSSHTHEKDSAAAVFELPLDLTADHEDLIPKENENTIAAVENRVVVDYENNPTELHENIDFTLQQEEGYEIPVTENQAVNNEEKTDIHETITFTLQQEQGYEISDVENQAIEGNEKPDIHENIPFTLQQEEEHELSATIPSPEPASEQHPVEDNTSLEAEHIIIDTQFLKEEITPVSPTSLTEPAPVSETPVPELSYTQNTVDALSETETDADTSSVIHQETEVTATEEKPIAIPAETIITENDNSSITPVKNVAVTPAEDATSNFAETVEERMTHVNITIDQEETLPEETAEIPHLDQETLIAEESDKQTFTVPAGDEIIIQGKKGTTITIPENSLVDKNGTPVTDSVTVELQEVYTKSEMLTTGLETSSEGKLLESGGMVNMQIKSADNEEVSLSENSSYTIELPTESKKADMTLFYADHTDGSMDWKLADRNVPDDSAYLENQKTLDKYVFRSSKLGWINADRFVGMEEKTNLRINLGTAPPDVSVCMVFSRLNSVLNMTGKKKDILFSHIPVGERATLVAFSKDGGKVMFASKDIIIQKDITESLTLQQLTETEFLEKIRALN